jgi:hypothetical protein
VWEGRSRWQAFVVGEGDFRGPESGKTCGLTASGSVRRCLLRFLSVHFAGLLERGQFLFPLGGLGEFAPGVVELHQPFEGFRDPARGI